MVGESKWRSSWYEAAFEHRSLPEVERCVLKRRMMEEAGNIEGGDGMIGEGGGCQEVVSVVGAVNKAEMSCKK
jgi:hypothetical protein